MELEEKAEDMLEDVMGIPPVEVTWAQFSFEALSRVLNGGLEPGPEPAASWASGWCQVMACDWCVSVFLPNPIPPSRRVPASHHLKFFLPPFVFTHRDRSDLPVALPMSLTESSLARQCVELPDRVESWLGRARPPESRPRTGHGRRRTRGDLGG
jgi:hypothetical protein